MIPHLARPGLVPPRGGIKDPRQRGGWPQSVGALNQFYVGCLKSAGEAEAYGDPLA